MEEVHLLIGLLAKMRLRRVLPVKLSLEQERRWLSLLLLLLLLLFPLPIDCVSWGDGGRCNDVLRMARPFLPS